MRLGRLSRHGAAAAALAGLLLVLPGQAVAGPVIIAVAASGIGAAAATGLGLVAGSFAYGLVSGAVGLVVSSLGASLFGKEAGPKQADFADTPASFQSESRGRTQVVRSAVETRKRVYGELPLSGPLVYAETTGTDNAYLHLVIPLAPHQVEAIGDVFFNDEAVGTLDASGNVTSGRFAGYARIKKHLGTTTQVADADLVAESAGLWTTDHRLQGVAYVYVRLQWSQDVFPQGIPNVKAMVKGNCLVFDPRDSGTRYTTNWQLVVRDYLVAPGIEGGLECAAEEVDDTIMVAGANVCDERVAMATHTNTFTADAAADLITLAADENTIATGDGVQVSTTSSLPGGLAALTTYYWIRKSATTAQLATTYANAIAGTALDITSSGSGTLTVSHIDQARYTANGTIDTGKRPLDILQDLMTGAAGVLTYPGGAFRVFPAAYATPAVTVTLDDLAGPIDDITTRVPRRDLFNAVRGTYSAAANFWQPSDFPVVTNATYAADDGDEVIYRDIALPYTNDAVRAQRLAKIHLEKSRQGITFSATYKMRLFDLAMWDMALITDPVMGWVAKPFRVTNWTLGENGIAVKITWREDAAASYDWAAGEATVVDPAPDTILPSPFIVAVPGAPTIAEDLYETSGSAGVKARAIVTWSAAADAFVSTYEAQFKPSSDSAWVSLAPVSLLSAQRDDLAPGLYDFRVRAINSIGVRSAWSATRTQEMFGLTAAPADVAGFSIIKSGGIAVAQWTRHADLDVRQGGSIVVRWSPATSGATWGNAIIYEEFAGAAVQGTLPLRTGTYMAKAKDSTGHYSGAAASFVATEGLVTGFTTVGTLTEHAAFTGSKTSVALVGVGIQLDTSALFDAGTGLFDSAPGYFDSYGGISATGSYAFSTYLDLVTVATRRFDSSIAVTQFDTGDLFDARTGDFDDATGLFDGAIVDDCDATLFISTTDDNPAGSPTWSAWVPFFVGDFTCRAAKFKLDLETPASNHNISVTALAVSAKIPA